MATVIINWGRTFGEKDFYEQDINRYFLLSTLGASFKRCQKENVFISNQSEECQTTPKFVVNW